MKSGLITAIRTKRHITLKCDFFYDYYYYNSANTFTQCRAHAGKQAAQRLSQSLTMFSYLYLSSSGSILLGSSCLPMH